MLGARRWELATMRGAGAQKRKFVAGCRLRRRETSNLCNGRSVPDALIRAMYQPSGCVPPVRVFREPWRNPTAPLGNGRAQSTVWCAGAPSGTMFTRTGGLPSCGVVRLAGMPAKKQPSAATGGCSLFRDLPARSQVTARHRARTAKTSMAAAMSSRVSVSMGTLLSPCTDSEGAAHVRGQHDSKHMFV